MKRVFIPIFLILVLVASPRTSRADNMTVFLKSCAYGTAAGAVLGLASLALSDNPSDKLNTVARGASLGLYAGIGYGLYVIYAPQAQRQDYSQVENPVWFSALRRDEKIVGAQINWANFSF